MTEAKSSALPVSSSPATAPPMDSGRATRIVSGCRKSANSKISTTSTIIMPKPMASANCSNISVINSASPVSALRTPAGRLFHTDSVSISASTSPMVRPGAKSASTAMRRARSKRSKLAEPCDRVMSATLAKGTLPPCAVGTARRLMASMSFLATSFSSTRMGIWRSGRLNLAEADSKSPTVAIRSKLPTDAGVMPSRAASSCRSFTCSSGFCSGAFSCTLAMLPIFCICAFKVCAACVKALGSEPVSTMDTSRCAKSFWNEKRMSANCAKSCRIFTSISFWLNSRSLAGTSDTSSVPLYTSPLLPASAYTFTTSLCRRSRVAICCNFSSVWFSVLLGGRVMDTVLLPMSLCGTKPVGSSGTISAESSSTPNPAASVVLRQCRAVSSSFK